MITGLAPSANGANRTGRMFTGDPSARFLYNALYKTGFANQPTSEFIGDGLKLIGCFLTAAVKCVPPDNTPTKQEFLNCSQYYHQELTLLKDVKCILVLGKHAFDSYKNFLKLNKVDTKQWTFSHGAHYTAEHFPAVYASYHPSPQNTNTGKMTEKMFLDLLETIKRIRGEPANS
jgi:uracil-DNA glycosylase family 4